MLTTKRITSSIALVLCLVLAACGSNALSAAAKIEAATSLACSSSFTIVSQAQQSGLMTTADATAVINVLINIEQINAQAETATAAIAAAPTSSNTAAANILTIVQPVSTAVTNAVNGGFVGIKDAGTKQKVLLAFTTAETALTAALAIIQVVK